MEEDFFVCWIVLASSENWHKKNRIRLVSRNLYFIVNSIILFVAGILASTIRKVTPKNSKSSWFRSLYFIVNSIIFFVAGILASTIRKVGQKESKSSWFSGWFGLSKMTTRPVSKSQLLKGAAGGDYGVRQLYPGETEYENAKEQFLVGAISLRPQPRILKIFSVQTNEEVSRSFEVAQRTVGNERSLFHGTSQQPHCNFAREGDHTLSTHRPQQITLSPNSTTIPMLQTQNVCTVTSDTSKYSYIIIQTKIH